MSTLPLLSGMGTMKGKTSMPLLPVAVVFSSAPQLCDLLTLDLGVSLPWGHQFSLLGNREVEW